MKTGDQKSSEDEFVVVYTSMGPLRAEVVKGRLQSAGIPTFLKYESAGTEYMVLVGSLGQVQVLVPKEREQAARELLKENPDNP